MKIQEHIDNLTRHINLVRQACEILSERLMNDGHKEMAVKLLARGYIHDNSKFYGIEWDYLHNGQDVPEEALELAIKQHNTTNDHHPEFWGGVDNMPEVCVAEMICDWYARSQEFGSSLRDWINQTAVKKYKIKKTSAQWKWINECLDLLLVNHFKPASG